MRRFSASRLWVSVLLVKALGYDAEAQSKMNVQLPFTDAGELPASLVGYVAAAVDHQLISGYPDGSLQPNRAVTRAEMAALLARGNGQVGDQQNRTDEIQGTVSAVEVTNNLIMVQGAHGTVSAYLAANAAIFVNGSPAALSAVQAGMNVWIKLDAGLAATLVDASSAGTGSTPAPQTESVSGTVTAVVQPANGNLGAITITPAGGTPVTAAVASQAQITANGTTATLAGVLVGATAQAQITSGVITQLTVTNPATGTTVQGRALAMVAPNGTTPGYLFLS